MRDLGLGPEVVERFLPHRAPLRLVDRLLAFEPGRPLRASKLISANEPVFAGHFPGFAIWPGAYTLEGLAQSAQLLLALEAASEQVDGGWKLLRRALVALAARHRLQPVAFDLSILDGLRPEEGAGVLVAADLRWTQPVLAGDVLEYTVGNPVPTQGMVRVDVEAHVGGASVARGSLMVARRPHP